MQSHQGINESQQQLILHAPEDDQFRCVDGVEITQNTDTIQDRLSSENGQQQEDLPKYKIIAYSMGHFFNDLCASMWFTYLLIFLEKVISLQSWQAGLLMLIGQVVDAISTPFVGLLSDHSFLPGFLARFGRRKAWHIIGTFFVLISFPLIFSGCLLCDKLHWLKFIWFIPPIMLFQFGWASVQISHLAMIPELTTSEHVRMSMTSLRFGFTVMANLSVFGVLYIFLNTNDPTTQIGPTDLTSFRNLEMICMGLGIIMTSIFYGIIKEPNAQRRISQLNLLEDSNPSGSHLADRNIRKMAWHNWFSYLHFYQTAALYLFSRVYINISQVYFSFFITQTLFRPKKYVALLPLTAFISSFVVSCLLGLSSINKRAKGKPLFLAGTFLGLINCLIMFFMKYNWPFISIILYVIASILGITQALLLICSLNTTATLINLNTESGAFVYGSMSFADKLSNGIIVQLVELFNPACQSQKSIPADCALFYRGLMSMIPGVSVIIIGIVLMTMNLQTLGRRLVIPTRNSAVEIPSEERNFEFPPTPIDADPTN